MATAILSAIPPSRFAYDGALDQAIRVEVLISALQDVARPRTLSELLRVLERVAVGDVSRELVSLIRPRAIREPNLLLTILPPPIV